MAMQIFNAVVDSIRNAPGPRPVRKYSERDNQRGQGSKPQQDPKTPGRDKPDPGSVPSERGNGGIDEVV